MQSDPQFLGLIEHPLNQHLVFVFLCELFISLLEVDCSPAFNDWSLKEL